MSLDHLFHVLKNLSDPRQAVTQHTIIETLASLKDAATVVRTWMYPRQHELIKRIWETPTHFKWLLWESSNREFQVYVHQYKPPQNIQRGYYALSVHNHRYWFASMMLRGTFQHLRYDIPKDTAGEFDVSGARIIDEVTVKAGDVYQLLLGEIHSVRDIQEETRTLVVQAKPERLWSETFLLEERRYIKVASSEEQAEVLFQSL
jgi:hypothetical protein